MFIYHLENSIKFTLCACSLIIWYGMLFILCIYTEHEIPEQRKFSALKTTTEKLKKNTHNSEQKKKKFFFLYERTNNNNKTAKQFSMLS